jgi:release factor glutamine methyltransferase
MDVRSALRLGIAQLRRANISSHTLAAELLLLHATGRSRTSLYSHPEDQLTEIEAQKYFVLIERRAVGVPTQHLTGKQEFWGLDFEVTPDVLVPRPETEHVIEVALDRLALRDLRSQQSQNMSGEGLLIADIGTGSGCIAIALAKELPAANIYALDISPAALAVAQRNAARFGFSDRINFVESDLLEKFLAAGAQPAASRQNPKRFVLAGESSFVAGRQSPLPRQKSLLFDLIVSNPPYVALREAATLLPEVRDHEPAVALFGGEEGYELYAGLIAQSAARLKAGGILVLELGHDSLPAVQPLLLTPAWVNVGVSNDLAGFPRVVSAERTDNP